MEALFNLTLIFITFGCLYYFYNRIKSLEVVITNVRNEMKEVLSGFKQQNNITNYQKSIVNTNNELIHNSKSLITKISTQSSINRKILNKK